MLNKKTKNTKKSTAAKITKRGDEEKANDLIATETVSGIQPEGKLAVDVYDTPECLVVVAPIAGVETADLEVLVEDEVLTIRGHRHHVNKGVHLDDYLSQECFWGNFSRSIILPANLDGNNINASFKRGILKIEIPKIIGKHSIEITD